MKHIGRFCAGLGICILILLIIASFDTDIAGLICIGLFCSVLLSAGLALIIIIPVIYLIGCATIALVKLFSHINKSAEEGFTATQQEKQKKLTKDVVALVAFLKKQEDCLRDREEITKDLEQVGWDFKTINFAYDIIERQR